MYTEIIKGTELLNFEIPLNTSIFKHSDLHDLQETRFDFITKPSSLIPISKKFAVYCASYAEHRHTAGKMCAIFNPYPTAFPYGNGTVLHFYQQQESSTTKTVHIVINKGLKAYV